MEKKIKILFTIPNFNTAGSGIAMFKIASNLNKDIFEPNIACLHDKGDYFKVVKNSGIPVHVINYLNPMSNKIGGLKHAWKVSRFLRKHKFDIIHSFHYAADYSEPIAAKMAGIKWVYTKKNMNWGGASRNGWRIRTLLAAGISHQNSDMKRLFFRNLNKTYLIPCGVDTTEFNQKGKDENIINEFNINRNDKVIICVANLVPVKGVEVLIDAFNEIADELPEVKLLIIGDDKNEYGQLLIKHSLTLKNSEKIIFTGKRPDVSLFFSIADLFVLPTLHRGEGSPVALLEAMASGTLVLGSKVPGIKDQLNTLPELLFTPGDKKELKKKMLWALRIDTERVELMEKINMIVKEKYTLEREIRQHEDMYLRILNRNV